MLKGIKALVDILLDPNLQNFPSLQGMLLFYEKLGSFCEAM